MTSDIDGLVADLTLEEKAGLTAGSGMFSTPAVDRLGIPTVNLTDGPSGARGHNAFPGFGGEPSTCIPCGSAIGATWDPAAAEALGELLGREALDRGCRGLLAPTVNLHRSPLAGRNFECYSEDPLLSGKLAVGFVRGVQSTGVFATVKHFVGNEAEYERSSISSVVDERTLRELYLLPFELAIREGGAHAVMTAYNRLNGRWLTEQPEYLIGLLREEWGFDGLVMTDWFAVADTATSLAAGLDLEMPGPGRSLGERLVTAINAGEVPEADLDAAVGRLLSAYDAAGILGQPVPSTAPKLTTSDDRALVRRVAADATVLLSNDGTLPLDGTAIRRVAVLGPNATTTCMVGGGSAGVIPVRLPNIAEAFSSALGTSVDVVHERGCEIRRSPALIGRTVLRAPEGFDAELFAGLDLAGEPFERRHLEELRLAVFSGFGDDAASSGDWSCRVRGVVVPDEDGAFELALAQSGRARLLIDGETVLDGFSSPPPRGGNDFFGTASQDLVTEIELSAGQPVELVVEYGANRRSDRGLPCRVSDQGRRRLARARRGRGGIGRCRGRGRGNERRVGDRGSRPFHSPAARPSGRARPARRRRQPAHCRRRQRRRPRRDALGRRRRCRAAVLVRGTGGRQRRDRCADRRRRARWAVADDDPAAARAQPCPRQLSRRER